MSLTDQSTTTRIETCQVQLKAEGAKERVSPTNPLQQGLKRRLLLSRAFFGNRFCLTDQSTTTRIETV